MYVAIINLVLAVYISASRSEIASEDGVLVLNEANFEEAIELYPQLLVKFYAPWCGHCKKLAPEWSKASAILSDNDIPFKLAKVDATEEKELATTYEIEGYPVIKHFDKGVVTRVNTFDPKDRSGGRKASKIVNWIEDKIDAALPAYVVLSSAKDIEAVQQTEEAIVVGVFNSLDSAAAAEFITLVNSDNSSTVKYAITDSAEVKTQLGTSNEAVITLTHFDDLRADLPLPSTNEAFDWDTVSAFILQHATPLLSTLTSGNKRKIYKRRIKKHLLIFSDDTADNEAHIELMKEYREVATVFAGLVMCIHVPLSETGLYKSFGIKNDELPRMVIADKGEKSSKKYYYNEDNHKQAKISHFIEEFLNGKLKPQMKTEKVLPTDMDGPVAILRGTSFHEQVLQSSKDVLVQFYVPWCGHCQALEPIYEELGEHFKDTEHIVVAKINMESNELPKLRNMKRVKSYPTIYLFRGMKDGNAQPSKPIRFTGTRRLASLVEFLENKAYHLQGDNDDSDSINDNRGRDDGFDDGTTDGDGGGSDEL